MRSKDYGVEVIRAYEFKRVGQVLYPTGMLRGQLVKCGFVKRRTAEDEQPASVVSINKKKPRLSLR